MISESNLTQHPGKASLGTEIAKARKERDELMTSKATLEKFAREKFFLKRPNEEIFLVSEPEEKK